MCAKLAGRWQAKVCRGREGFVHAFLLSVFLSLFPVLLPPSLARGHAHENACPAPPTAKRVSPRGQWEMPMPPLQSLPRYFSITCLTEGVSG